MNKSSRTSVRPGRIDANQIYKGLWQGSEPPTGRKLADAGFGAVVLCAVEYQLGSDEFPGVRVIHCPFDDAKNILVQSPTMKMVSLAARHAANLLRVGENVLVTCHMGINRSGLVTGLVLHRLTGWDGGRIVQLIRHKREGALRNEAFVTELMKLQARRTRV